MKLIANFMAVVMLIMALLVKFGGVELDFNTMIAVSTLGVFAGCLASSLKSFQQFMPDFCQQEGLCA